MSDDTEILTLPDLVLLENFGGNFTKYLFSVYEYFKHDFIDYHPIYRGIKLGLKKHPLIDGKPYTFYHMTHSGDIENERIPDLRRMERIRYPRPMIENSQNPYLKVWENIRDKKVRILIWHEKEEYLVVLEKRKDYILPWTAYLVTQNHRKTKLQSEYENYIKSRNRQ